jgi:sialidase-1
MKHEQPICEKRTLEQHDQGGWSCYRIPGMIVTAAGTLLAYYETRLDASDWNTRNIGLRRSTDDGVSWSSRRDLIEQPGDLTINNPVMIATRRGRIHFFWEQNYNRFFQQFSDDDGLTWSEPVERTPSLIAIRNRYAWTVFGLGPGHGIEISDGRLLLPVWLCNGGGRAHHPSVVTTLASDDDGETWHCGEILPLATGQGQLLVNPNESALAQLNDSRILINMRHETPRRRRAMAISDNGTLSWSSPWLADDLPDPVCCAGLVRLPGLSAGAPDCLAFSNCATEGPQRTDLTVRISRDDGKSWQAGQYLEKLAGYSDLAASPDGQWLYCFYEQGRDESAGACLDRLILARMNRAWLGLKEV